MIGHTQLINVTKYIVAVGKQKVTAKNSFNGNESPVLNLELYSKYVDIPTSLSLR